MSEKVTESLSEMQKRLDDAWKLVRKSGNDPHLIADAMRLDVAVKKARAAASLAAQSASGKARMDKLDTAARILKNFKHSAEMPESLKAQAETLQTIFTELTA